MPADMIRSGRVPVMSLPSNQIRPAVGWYRPVSMLKNVVLPAPLGPMIETIDRRGIAKSTSDTATRPPKTFETDLATSRSLDGGGPAAGVGVGASATPSLMPAPRRGRGHPYRRPPPAR